MNRRQRTHAAAHRGVALLVTMIFLVLFACLAVAIAASADVNLTIAHNRIEGQQALALAGTGLQLIQKSLGGMSCSAASDATTMHALIHNHLMMDFAGSAMVATNSIATTANGVTLPTITLTRADGGTGTVNLNVQASGGATDDTTVTIRAISHFGSASRSATYNMTVQRGRSVLRDYGLASKSVVQMTGNAQILGANDPAEGNVLSATYSATNAIVLTGNIQIAGDAAVVNPAGRISKTGNVHINGNQIIGAAEPEWPQVDITDFKQYATNVYSGSGSGNLTLSNIRIPPNTNPTFSGNLTVRGVVYIQSPNKVTFSGNCTLIGCVVADQPAADNLNANQIKFTGNLSTAGVENLPADAQYDGLRDLKGSFLLAPGYSAQFTGNFNTVNGCMVASEFKFTGNAGGTVKGGIVNLRDSSLQLTGNARLVIDREHAEAEPAGIVSTTKLVCVSGSYAE
jgi:hypothetical protein